MYRLIFIHSQLRRLNHLSEERKYSVYRVKILLNEDGLQ